MRFSKRSMWTEMISTHAPAQGATRNGCSTSSRGTTFQPTLPHRERQWRRPGWWHILNFNPRSRTGSDAVNASSFPAKASFQPTLPHRERQDYPLISSDASLFQPTLPHRERPVKVHTPGGREDFNPRSRTGSDGAKMDDLVKLQISTHAPAQGATRGCAGKQQPP